MNCTTHHHACKCRERKFRELLTASEHIINLYAPHLHDKWIEMVSKLYPTSSPIQYENNFRNNAE